MAGFWAALPPGRVTHLVGAGPEAIVLALEPLPADAPAVVTCRCAAEPSSSRVVEAILDRLETAALDLYPAWLPGAEEISGPQGAGVPAVRALAAAKASTTPHFGPFLADLAVRSLSNGSTAARFPAETRAAGLARVIADSFHRTSTALLIVPREELDRAAEQALLAGSEWLAHHGGIAVWLTGPWSHTRDLVPAEAVDLPVHVASLAGAGSTAAAPPFGPTALQLPAMTGRPHPGSQAEQVLEAALASAPWASGRVWNQTFQPDPLANPIRVDLMWPAERCAIEIDGADHREALHYEADRRRDVQLQLAGFAVLRFTNAQTLADTGAVLAQIEQFLTIRRRGKDGHAG